MHDITYTQFLSGLSGWTTHQIYCELSLYHFPVHQTFLQDSQQSLGTYTQNLLATVVHSMTKHPSPHQQPK